MLTQSKKACAVFAAVSVFAFGAAYGGGPTTHDVFLNSMTFSPQHVTIELGDTVRFVWNTSFHDVVQTTEVNGCIAQPGGFISGDFIGDTNDAGHIWELTFNEAMLQSNPVEGNVYPYMCSVHCSFGMRGTVTVTVPEPECPADLTGDGSVGVPDLLELLAAWGSNPGHAADLNGDDSVGVPDLLQLLGAWGDCP